MDEEFLKLMQENIERLKKLGVKPCPKHHWTSMNNNGTCEACKKEDFPEDFLGIE